MNSDSPLTAPYPGLRSFRRSETELFFGRDDCINDMIDRLAATRFLAVLGASGTGKSSLVKAGLLDGLELGLMAQAGSNWAIAEFRPEGTPLANLARGLLQLQEPGVAHADADVELLRTFLARGPRSIVEWCRGGHLSKGQNLLLLVDQFEELFRYRDYAGREEAEAFVALLIESARASEFPIYIAITMRSEYLSACSLINDLAEEINRGMYLTTRMTREQCREAIVGPARVFDIKISDALVNRLLNDLAGFAPWEDGDVHDEAGNQLDRLVRRADQLPLLQYTLNRMWLVAPRGPNGAVALDLADYQGLSFALNEHADQIFAALDAEHRPVETVFRALTIGTTVADAVRQPTRLDELIAICNGDEAGVRAVVEAYRAPGCNFLLPEVDPQKPLGLGTVIDISHESLIRQWRRLSEWLAKEALAAQQWRRLVDRFGVGELLRGRELANMTAWRAEVQPNAAWAKRYGGNFPAVEAYLEHSERIDRRKRRLRTAAVAAVFLVLLSTTVVAVYEWREANVSLAQAKIAQQRAENSYAVAKDVLGSLVLDFADRATTLLPSEVTDLSQRETQTIDRLAAADPDDVELIGIHARLLDKFVDAYQHYGAYYELALDMANQVNGLLRKLVQRDPKNTKWPTLLAVNYGKVGDLTVKLFPKKADEALANYTEALKLDRDLTVREPQNEDHPRQAAIDLVKIGQLQRDSGDLAAAEKSYLDALDLRQGLAKTYSIIPVYLRDVAATHDVIGSVRQEKKDFKAALSSYEDALSVRRKVNDLKFGLEFSDRQDYAINLDAIGSLQVVLGRADDARRSYEAGLQIYRQLEKNNNSLWLQQRISRDLFQLADIRLDGNDVAAARQAYVDAFQADERAVDLAFAAYNKNTSDSGAQDDVVRAYGHAAWSGSLAGQPAKAANYAETIIKFDGSQTWIRINQAHAYLLLGRYDDAKAIYLAWKDKPRSSRDASTFTEDIKNDFDLLKRLGRGVENIVRMAKDLGIEMKAI